MRIPNYQRQIDYQRVTPRGVALTAPTFQTSRSKGWDRFESILQATKAFMPTYKGLFNIGEKYKHWFRQGEILFDKSDDEKSNVPTGTRPQYAESGFSSPARQELLQFVKQQLGNSVSETKQRETHPLWEKLDDYFVQQMATEDLKRQIEDPDQDLLAQDYVVLRREMQQVQAAQLAEQQTAQFYKGAGNFIELSSLIRSPQALKQYVQDNLTAAEKEYSTHNSSNVSWDIMKQNLFNLSIAHNINASLQMGEVEQARYVYDYFKPSISEEQCKLLENKIMYAQATQTAQKELAKCYVRCVSAEGKIDSTKMTALAEELTQENHLPLDIMQPVLQTCLEQEVCKNYKEKAQVCRQILEGKEAALAEEASSVFSPKQWKQIKQWQDESKIPYESGTYRAVFNGLYDEILQGKATPEDVANSYQAKEISARDALRLTEHFCALKGGEQKQREILLSGSVKNWCQKNHFTPEQTEQAYYFVFGSGCDWQSHLSAAQELKDIFTLQEKK